MLIDNVKKMSENNIEAEGNKTETDEQPQQSSSNADSVQSRTLTNESPSHTSKLKSVTPLYTFKLNHWGLI